MTERAKPLPTGRGRPSGPQHSASVVETLNYAPYDIEYSSKWKHVTKNEAWFCEKLLSKFSADAQKQDESYTYLPPRPSQRHPMSLAQELTSGDAVRLAMRPVTIWAPHMYFHLASHPCCYGNKACKPRCVGLDPRGPLPVSGVGESSLLWPVSYQCSVCVTRDSSTRPSDVESKAKPKRKRVWRSTTVQALAALPRFLQATFERDFCFLRQEDLNHEHADSKQDDTTDHTDTRNRLFVTKALADIARKPVIGQFSFGGLSKLLNQINHENALLSAITVLECLSGLYEPDNTSSSQLTISQYFSHPSTDPAQTWNSAQIKAALSRMSPIELITSIGVPVLTAPDEGFLKRLFTTKMVKQLLSSVLHAYPPCLCTQHHLRPLVESQMLKETPAAIALDQNHKMAYISVAGENGINAPAFGGLLVVMGAECGNVIACSPVASKSHTEVEPVLKGLAQRYLKAGKEVFAVCTDNSRSDQAMIERCGLPTPSDDLFHVQVRLIQTVNQKANSFVHPRFCREITDAFFVNSRDITTGKVNPARTLREGEALISEVDKVVRSFAMAQPGYITPATWEALRKLKALVNDKLVARGDPHFDNKRPSTGVCEAYFKRVGECIAVGGTQGPELYCCKNIQLALDNNVSSVETWRGEPSYHVLFPDPLVRLNRVCLTICGELPFPNHEPIESDVELTFFYPRPSVSSSPKPQFNPDLVKAIVASLCFTQTESPDHASKFSLALNPLSSETLALPLFGLSEQETPKGVTSSDTKSLQLSAGQPLPPNFDPHSLITLKAAEFMKLFTQTDVSVAKFSITDKLVLKQIQAALGSQDCRLSSSLWYQITTALSEANDSVIPHFLNKVKLSKYKSTLHIEQFCSDTLSHRDLTGALSDARDIISTSVPDLEKEAEGSSSLKSESTMTDDAQPVPTSSISNSPTSSSLAIRGTNTPFNLKCGCSLPCSSLNPYSGVYTPEEDNVATTFLTALQDPKELASWSFILHETAWQEAYKSQSPKVHWRGRRSLYDRYGKHHEPAKAKLLELKRLAGMSDEKAAQTKTNREAKREGAERPVLPFRRPLQHLSKASTIDLTCEASSSSQGLVSSGFLPESGTISSQVSASAHAGVNTQLSDQLSPSVLTTALSQRAEGMRQANASWPIARFLTPKPPFSTTISAGSQSGTGELREKKESEVTPTSETHMNSLSTLTTTPPTHSVSSSSSSSVSSSQKEQRDKKVESKTKGLNASEKRVFEILWKNKVKVSSGQSLDAVGLQKIYQALVQQKRVVDGLEKVPETEIRELRELAKTCRPNITAQQFNRQKKTVVDQAAKEFEALKRKRDNDEGEETSAKKPKKKDEER